MIVQRIQPECYPSLAYVETVVVPRSPIPAHLATRAEHVEGHPATIALPQTAGATSIPAYGEDSLAVSRFIDLLDPGANEWLMLKSFDKKLLIWEELLRDLSQMKP